MEELSGVRKWTIRELWNDELLDRNIKEIGMCRGCLERENNNPESNALRRQFLDRMIADIKYYVSLRDNKSNGN